MTRPECCRCVAVFRDSGDLAAQSKKETNALAGAGHVGETHPLGSALSANVSATTASILVASLSMGGSPRLRRSCRGILD